MAPALRALGLTVVAMLGAARASAQEARDLGEPHAEAQDEARVLFEEGVRAFDDGRFADAVDRLERSFAIRPRPSVAYNLAMALVRASRPRAAIAILDRLLAEELGPLPETMRPAAQALLGEARQLVATLVVRARGAPRIELLIDGALVGRVADGGAVRSQIDPGEHRAEARAPRRRGASLMVTAEPGSVEQVGLELAPERDGSHAARAGPSSSSTDRESDSAVPWLIGAGVAVALVAAVVVVVLALGAAPEREHDPIFGSTGVLRSDSSLP